MSKALRDERQALQDKGRSAMRGVEDLLESEISDIAFSKATVMRLVTLHNQTRGELEELRAQVRNLEDGVHGILAKHASQLRSIKEIIGEINAALMEEIKRTRMMAHGESQRGESQRGESQRGESQRSQAPTAVAPPPAPPTIVARPAHRAPAVVPVRALPTPGPGPRRGPAPG